MNGITCEQVRDHLEMYISNEVDAELAGSIGDHLKECAACRAEAGEVEKLIGLLDLQQREAAGVARLRARIAAESPTIRAALPRTKKNRVAVPQSLAALAAALLLPMGLAALLSQSGTAEQAEGVRVALLAQGREKTIPGPIDQKLVRGGKDFKSIAESIRETAGTVRMPLPREVTLSIVISNPTRQPLEVDFQSPRAELRWSIAGPGVVEVPGIQGTDRPFAGIGTISIPPGGSKAIAVNVAFGGSQESPRRVYLLADGDYRILATVRVPSAGNPRGKLLEFASQPIRINVD